MDVGSFSRKTLTGRRHEYFWEKKIKGKEEEKRRKIEEKRKNRNKI